MNLYIVTGSTRGLGKALADAIARAGDNELIALGRAPEGPIPGGYQLEIDLADTRALEALWERVAKRIGGRRYDKAVLINNAGVVAPVGPLEALDAAELDRSLQVNLVAPMLLMRGFLRATEPIAALRRIVNISSGAGRRPIFGWSAYCAAKAGLDMASRVVALEASTRGLAVEVTSLAPGVIDTDMQAHVREQPPEAFADVERFRQMKEKGGCARRRTWPRRSSGPRGRGGSRAMRSSTCARSPAEAEYRGGCVVHASEVHSARPSPPQGERMKRALTLAVSLLFAAGAAYASHCPTHGKAIDEALAKKPKLTEAQTKEVQELKKKGDDAHKAGNHKEAMEHMHKAMDIMGLKHE